MSDDRSSAWLHSGIVAAALGASLCCVLPLAVALLGVGSAAAAAWLAPLRPYLLLLTFGLLGAAFYRDYRPRPCAPGEACALPAARRRQRILLWSVALLALALMAFPYYVGWLF